MFEFIVLNMDLFVALTSLELKCNLKNKLSPIGNWFFQNKNFL